MRIGRKDVLFSITGALEAQALTVGQHAVIVAAFQHAQQFTAPTRTRSHSWLPASV